MVTEDTGGDVVTTEPEVVEMTEDQLMAELEAAAEKES